MNKNIKYTKDKRVFPTEGKLYVLSLPNNTKLTVTTVDDRVLEKLSVGMCGFKGSRKSTPFAATNALNKLLSILNAKGMKNLTCVLTGMHSGRNGVLQGLAVNNLVTITKVVDKTSIPHNGARRPTRRRT